MKLSRLVEAAIKKGGIVHRPGVPIGQSITVEGKKLELHMDPHDHRAGYNVVHINHNFENAFKEDAAFYIGENGDGGIGERYSKIGEFVNSAEYITIPDVYVNARGGISFGNGRHRYAWMRDHGITNFPVAMDDESLTNAKKFGYVKDVLHEDIGPAAAGLVMLINDVRKIFAILNAHKNSKGAVNDQVLNRIYRQELKLFKAAINGLPNVVILKFKNLLSKYNISLVGGVDLHRNNLQRIIILKLSRLFLALVGDTLQDPSITVVSMFSRGLGIVFDLILNINDYKSAVFELRRCYIQITRIVNKINHNKVGPDEIE